MFLECQCPDENGSGMYPCKTQIPSWLSLCSYFFGTKSTFCSLFLQSSLLCLAFEVLHSNYPTNIRCLCPHIHWQLVNLRFRRTSLISFFQHTTLKVKGKKDSLHSQQNYFSHERGVGKVCSDCNMCGSKIPSFYI